MKRHPNYLFSIKTEKEICRLYKIGVKNNSTNLSKKFGCNWTTIINILHRNKVKVRTRSESQIDLRTGKNHPYYKGGNISPYGYKRVYVNKKCVQEHRYIMEKNIGRLLKTTEIIHHINGDKLDNKIINLQIVSRSEHKKLHPEIGIKTRFK